MLAELYFMRRHPKGERHQGAHVVSLLIQPSTGDGLKERTSHSSNTNALGRSLAPTHSEPWETTAPSDLVSVYLGITLATSR